MTRRTATLLLASGCLTMVAACGGGSPEGPAPKAAPPVEVTTTAVRRQLVSDVLRMTGSLVAEQEAQVAAETAGRVVRAPVERGGRVTRGAVLVALSKVEAEAQAQEAEANVAQLEARLALAPGDGFDVAKVAEVASARAARDLAEAEYGRIKSLLDERVVSQAEFDQRRTQFEAARNQYAAARNAALQQYRMLEAVRARAALARKNLADTDIRAPFSGVVVERLVGVGDFVTRGTRVATLVRVSPLRLELTVPEQSIGLIRVGQPIGMRVDAYPDRMFHGQIRYVAPALRADQRALTVEAVVANEDGTLKPGMFASAELRMPAEKLSLVVPTTAVQAVEGISRVYVIRDGAAEERIVTTGATAGAVTEILKGLSEGDDVAVDNVMRLSDGVRVKAVAVAPAAGRPPASGRR
ncbi:MAG: efflux RND transporter periplasmic adaptor subunit [Acidobacteriota bacterium]